MLMAMMTGVDRIRVGTSGYSFLGWKGVFYPRRIDRGKVCELSACMVARIPPIHDVMDKAPASLTNRREDLTAKRNDSVNATSFGTDRPEQLLPAAWKQYVFFDYCPVGQEFFWLNTRANRGDSSEPEG